MFFLVIPQKTSQSAEQLIESKFWLTLLSRKSRRNDPNRHSSKGAASAVPQRGAVRVKAAQGAPSDFECGRGTSVSGLPYPRPCLVSPPVLISVLPLRSGRHRASGELSRRPAPIATLKAFDVPAEVYSGDEEDLLGGF